MENVTTISNGFGLDIDMEDTVVVDPKKNLSQIINNFFN